MWQTRLAPLQRGRAVWVTTVLWSSYLSWSVEQGDCVIKSTLFLFTVIELTVACFPSYLFSYCNKYCRCTYPQWHPDKHTQANTYTPQQTYILIHMLKRCLDLWHTAAPQPGSELLYVSICGEHLWQMGDTLKSHRPLHFPKEQLPGTTNHSSVHFSSSPFSLPSPQAPAAAGERFNTTHRCKWQNRQAHEKKKKQEKRRTGRRNSRGDLDLLADEGERGKINQRE